MNTKIRNFIVNIVNAQITTNTATKAFLFKKFLRQFEGMECWLSITPKVPKRSERQNSFYFVYLTLIEEITGTDKDTIHAWAKGKFLTTDITEFAGDKVRVTKSTTELTAGEFIEYMMNIEADLGIPAPDPTPFKLPLNNDEYWALREKQSQFYQDEYGGTKILDLKVAQASAGRLQTAQGRSET